MQNYILLKRKRENDGYRVEYEIFYSKKDNNYYRIGNKIDYNPALIGFLVVFSMTFKWLERFYLSIENILINAGWLGIILPYLLFSFINIFFEYKKFSKRFENKKNLMMFENFGKENIKRTNIIKLYIANWIKFVIVILISIIFLLLLMNIDFDWQYRACVYMLIWAFSNWGIYLIFTESLFSWKTAVVVVEQYIKQKLIKDNE